MSFANQGDRCSQTESDPYSNPSFIVKFDILLHYTWQRMHGSEKTEVHLRTCQSRNKTYTRQFTYGTCILRWTNSYINPMLVKPMPKLLPELLPGITLWGTHAHIQRERVKRREDMANIHGQCNGVKNITVGQPRCKHVASRGDGSHIMLVRKRRMGTFCQQVRTLGCRQGCFLILNFMPPLLSWYLKWPPTQQILSWAVLEAALWPLSTELSFVHCVHHCCHCHHNTAWP